MAGEYEDMS